MSGLFCLCLPSSALCSLLHEDLDDARGGSATHGTARLEPLVFRAHFAYRHVSTRNVGVPACRSQAHHTPILRWVLLFLTRLFRLFHGVTRLLNGFRRRRRRCHCDSCVVSGSFFLFLFYLFFLFFLLFVIPFAFRSDVSEYDLDLLGDRFPLFL